MEIREDLSESGSFKQRPEEVREQTMRPKEPGAGMCLLTLRTERPCGWACKSNGQCNKRRGQGGWGQIIKDLLGPGLWFVGLCKRRGHLGIFSGGVAGKTGDINIL